MSDGMSDARALSELNQKLINASHQLGQAITEAEEGHRGWTVDIEDAVNAYLPSGWNITPQDHVKSERNKARSKAFEEAAKMARCDTHCGLCLFCELAWELLKKAKETKEENETIGIPTQNRHAPIHWAQCSRCGEPAKEHAPYPCSGSKWVELQDQKP